jgi:hypothetical protein
MHPARRALDMPHSRSDKRGGHSVRAEEISAPNHTQIPDDDWVFHWIYLCMIIHEKRFSTGTPFNFVFSRKGSFLPCFLENIFSKIGRRSLIRAFIASIDGFVKNDTMVKERSVIILFPRRTFMASELKPIPLLTSIPLFSDLAPEHQESISRVAHVSSHKKAEEIFHEGDVPEFLYVVLEGRVALEMHIPNRGRLRILTVEPFEVLGWSSIVDINRKRIASATAVTAVKLLAIDAMKLHQACQEDPRLGFVIMHQVANVIAGRLIATRMQLLDMFANPPSEASHG